MTKNVMVRGNSDPLHEGVKDIVSRWGLEHGYWFTQEDKAYQDLTKPHRPDVVLHARKRHANRHSLVIVEIQRKIDPQWLGKMRSQYKGQCLIIIPLKHLEKVHNSYEHLKLLVSVQMDLETERYIPKHKKPSNRKKTPSDNEYGHCQRCGKPKLKKNLVPTTLGRICKPCKKELWRKEHGR